MNLNKNNFLIYFSLFLGCAAFSQETQKDTTKIEELKEVVVTGQHNPQSVKKSVFEVKILTRKDIEQQAANNLADLLNQTLNINVIPNASSGKSGVSLFGLDSQYFKVLIDNVPVVNEEGFGNSTDLTLMNLDDIQQIEIVEGSMGVQYGSNAVSGIINIITKKSSTHKTQIQTYVQEETVGDEYEWFDKGRHIQSVQASHNFTDKIYGSIVYNRNDFAGFWDDKQGKYHDVNDNQRGHRWLPKTQQNAKVLLRYASDKINIFYKFDYLHELIEKNDSLVRENENVPTNTSNPFSFDQKFYNNRFVHLLNANGGLGSIMNYDISLSYQEQTKDVKEYNYYIREDRESNNEKEEYQYRKALFSRGTLSNIIKTEKTALQAGYEITSQKGFGNALSADIGFANNIENKLDNYDVFTDLEYKVSPQFSIRPGVRSSYSNQFDPQYMVSLSSRYLFKNNIELRGVIGSAPRTPTYDELFTYLVDINHNVQGNPNLNPEKGFSAFLHLKKTSYLNDNTITLSNKISASYLDVSNRIELIITNNTPLTQQYNNIDKFKAITLFSENEFQYDNFQARLGVSVLGISKILDSSTASNDDFLYSLQLNSSVSYQVPKWNSTFALYYKYVGKQHQFVEVTNLEGNQEFIKGTTDAYGWLDATTTKSFFKDSLKATIGVRNLLDVSTVNTTALAAGAHNAAPTGLMFSYGRSYFIKLAYNLNM